VGIMLCVVVSKHTYTDLIIEFSEEDAAERAEPLVFDSAEEELFDL